MKPWTEQDPFWQRLEGPNQVSVLIQICFSCSDASFKYPDHPGARQLVEEYIGQIESLAQSFVHLVAECLSLPADTFDSFKGNMSRLKFVKYPQSAPNSQGVGPHKDSAGLFTFLSQDSTGGLQVLNKNGDWIDVPPVEGSLVVNIQQGFEAITGGVCAATTHRVIVRCFYLQYSTAADIIGTHLSNTIQHSLLPRGPVGLDAGSAQRVGCSYCSPHSCLGRPKEASS